jgi:hypothetical protein
MWPVGTKSNSTSYLFLHLEFPGDSRPGVNYVQCLITISETQTDLISDLDTTRIIRTYVCTYICKVLLRLRTRS